MSYFRQKCTKFDFGWGSAPHPAGGAHVQHCPESKLDLRGPTPKGKDRGWEGRRKGGRKGKAGGKGEPEKGKERREGEGSG